MERSIRRADAADGAAVAEIYAPYVLETPITFEDAPPPAAEMARRIADLRPRFPWLVLEEAGRVQGYAYASVHRARKAYQWSTEVSVYVRSSARGRGLGRALYAPLLELLRRQGFVNLYAGITTPNDPSLRLHESFGFAPFAVFARIGFKLGAWHDVAWLQRRFEPPAVPADPIPADAIFGEPWVADVLSGPTSFPGRSAAGSPEAP